ncbi:phage tail tube protein [Lacticaseibacillus saniviri]|uniref:phage tail tube protein n=1 Tax=Lacticaseibacillus saniviri TaxID=931533 RepID=UPI000B1B40AB
MIELKELSAKLEKNKEEVQVIGSRITKNKTTSMKGTGTLSGYLINSNWVKYGLDFAHGKSDLYFDITSTIEDTTSRTGKQTILLKDVNLDEIPVLNLNSDDGVLDWETDFTFDDTQLVNAFAGVNSAE